MRFAAEVYWRLIFLAHFFFGNAPLSKSLLSIIGAVGICFLGKKFAFTRDVAPVISESITISL